MRLGQVADMRYEVSRYARNDGLRVGASCRYEHEVSRYARNDGLRVGANCRYEHEVSRYARNDGLHVGSVWMVLVVILLSAGCLDNRRGVAHKVTATSSDTTNEHVQYATGFTVTRHHIDGTRPAAYTEVKVRDPWDTTKLLHHYILVDKTQPLLDDWLPHLLANMPPTAILVRTPLQRMVVCTSVHCGMLEMLGVEARIVGVCESKYIRTDFVQRGLASGTITDIGEATAPDIEKLVELGPDAMVTSPVGNAPTGRVEKTGIPQIKCVDYMEQHPLGRAEWLRFLALFVGKEVVADSIFNDIANSYNEVKSLVADVKQLPTVLTEMRIGSTWYVPGGQSYVANLLRDAGANYLWADNSHAGSVPLSFESVFERSCEADFWLIKYNRPQELTYESLKQEYLPYSQFEAFKKRNIFVCNTGKVNFYEETPLRPDWLLRECVLLFHPYALKGYQRQYYKEMQ